MMLAMPRTLHDPDRLEARYKRAMVRRFFVRFHMALILGGAGLAGVAANAMLFLAHVTSMPCRYALAVAVSYLAFLGLVRVWLACVRADVRQLPLPDVSLDWPSWSSRGGGQVAQAFRGGRGGSFGGAGAQGSWTEPVPRQASVSSSGVRSGGSRWLPDLSLDIDLDEKAIVILIAFAALVLSVAGAAVYMIWNAPSILGDAAFQLALSASLIGAARRMAPTWWVGGVVRRTCIPFAIVLVLAVAFGLVVRGYCPRSPTLRAVVTQCLAAHH
jgi:hypothetical protein